jgi:hypothetical protein
VVYTADNRKNLAAATSEEEARLKYTNQSFARQIFFGIFYIHVLAAKY